MWRSILAVYMMSRYALVVGCIALGLSVQAQLDHSERWPSPEALLDGVVWNSSGDEMNVAEAYTEANRLIIEQNWLEAEVLLGGLFKNDPTNRNFAYKWALCLRSIPGRMEEAVPLVHLAVDGPFADRYNAFAPDETLPPEEALELGLEVLQLAYHFTEAQGLAQDVVARYSKRDYRHKRALEVMEECDFALGCVANPVAVEIVEEVALNSESADYAPVISPDGNTLYFTSHRTMEGRFREEGRIYRSTRTAHGWSRPVRLELGTAGREITTVGLVGDDDALLAYQGYRGEGSIWKLKRDANGGWTQEEKLGFPIDSRHWETAASERFDGKERIFVSDRPGGFGGRDLYRTVMLPDGTWSEPLNLGSRINSDGEEESPVISADGQTLVFASNGLPGMGGFDLYRCRRLDNGSWSDPEHLGHPLNTPGDEAVLSLDASGQAGYISSARGGGDDLDIYSVKFLEEPGEELAVMLGEVTGWERGDVMEVRATDGGPSVFRVFRARASSGKFLAALPPCREYSFRWVRRGEILMEREEAVACVDAYGASGEVRRLDPFVWDGVMPTAPSIEGETLGQESEEDVVTEAVTEASIAMKEDAGKIQPDMAGSETRLDAKENSMEAPVDKSAEDNEETDGTTEPAENPVEFIDPDSAPVTMLTFEAVQARVDFGYGRYVTEEENVQMLSVARHIAERNAAGEIPVLNIKGSASYVPVKNKRAYESNEQLAKMRAEHARDAMITELAKRGMQAGIDYQIVLEWEVAGPGYKGDAIQSVSTYRSYQYAQFSLSRALVEKRRG